MKKLKLLLVGTLLLPIVVKADMGAPEIKPYKMVVINQDGIDCYNKEYDDGLGKWVFKDGMHINKDETFEVYYEYNDEYSVSVGDNSCTLKSLEGAKIVDEEIDPVKEEGKDHAIRKLSSSENALVYDKDGVDIRKGPSTAYDKIAHIKKGTKLSYIYQTDSYIYVEYNGKKGWIYVLDSKVLFENKVNYIAKNEVKMSCGTIPKNAIVSSNYEADKWSGTSLINYKNCEDFVRTFKTYDLLIVNKKKATAKSDLDMYEYSEQSGSKITTIPSDAEIIVVASFRTMGEDKTDAYVTYNGKEGWIYFASDELEIDENAKVTEDTIETEDKKEETKKENKKETTEEKTTSNKKDPDDFVLTCVIVGASVAVVAVIIIILVNNKKKNKPAEEKVEQSNNEEDMETIEQSNSEEQEENNEVAFCSQCGAQVKGSFCSKCGAKIEK